MKEIKKPKKSVEEVEKHRRITEFRGDYQFLSNFYVHYDCPIVMDGLSFPSGEAAYQAQKEPTKAKRKEYEHLPPGEAKKRGQLADLPINWNAKRIGIMTDVVRRKFQAPRLAAKLLATEDAELVEFNNWGDFFWGFCRGKGENHLGKILMKIRKELQEEK